MAWAMEEYLIWLVLAIGCLVQELRYSACCAAISWTGFVLLTFVLLWCLHLSFRITVRLRSHIWRFLHALPCKLLHHSTFHPIFCVPHQSWTVTRYIYLSTVLKYVFFVICTLLSMWVVVFFRFCFWKLMTIAPLHFNDKCWQMLYIWLHYIFDSATFLNFQAEL